MVVMDMSKDIQVEFPNYHLNARTHDRFMYRIYIYVYMRVHVCGCTCSYMFPHISGEWDFFKRKKKSCQMCIHCIDFIESIRDFVDRGAKSVEY